MLNEKAVLRVEQSLAALAASWRAGNTEQRQQIEKQYSSLLEALLSWGWKDGLDPDSELPDLVMPESYLKAIGRRK